MQLLPEIHTNYHIKIFQNRSSLTSSEQSDSSMFLLMRRDLEQQTLRLSLVHVLVEATGQPQTQIFVLLSDIEPG